MARVSKSRKKFDIINNLTTMSRAGGEQGIAARKALRDMPNVWLNRSMPAGGMHKRKNAAPSVCEVLS